MNYVPIVVATDLEVHFSVLKKGVSQYFCLCSVCTSHWCLVMSFWLKVCIYSHTRGVKLGLGLGFLHQVLPHWLNQSFSFFFVINNFLFFFHTQHNIQNKTKQNSRHILNISRFNQKGGREGRTTKNTKVTPLNNYVYSTKNTAKPQWLKAWPHRLVPLYIHMTQLQEAADPICLSTHVWCKPVLNYCLLHSCKTSKQHSLLHWTNTEIRIIIKKT